jgi:hypothetical protein
LKVSFSKTFDRCRHSLRFGVIEILGLEEIMNNVKMKRVYQIANLIGAVISGLFLACFLAWLSASDELKHPCIGNAQVPCLESFEVTFQYFFKKYLLFCLGSFLLAYLIQLAFSLKYFSKYNGIFIGFIGIMLFSISAVSCSQDTVKSVTPFTFISGFVFALLMALILSPLFVYERIKRRKSEEILP